jgi:sRNA-binding carbon storage regulator CsrA
MAAYFLWKLLNKASSHMEIITIEFEKKLVIIINNHKVDIIPFLMKDDPGTIKLGIDAPFEVSVNREEIHKRKQEQQQLEQQDTPYIDYAKKIPAIFTELLSVTHKSEKLEDAAQKLFHKDKILTPKSIEKIARGDMPTSKWIVTCAIDILITERFKSINKFLSPYELFVLWAKPLLNRTTENQTILTKSSLLDMPLLIEHISNYSNTSKRPVVLTIAANSAG